MKTEIKKLKQTIKRLENQAGTSPSFGLVAKLKLAKKTLKDLVVANDALVAINGK